MDTTTIELSSIVTLAGIITAVGTAWLTVNKIKKDYKKARELESAEILQQAKEDLNRHKDSFLAERRLYLAQIEQKIDDVQADLDAHKESIAKDFHHLRETYNGEIRNLGTKIEDLRSELRNQHGQLVGLLTKMIENRD